MRRIMTRVRHVIGSALLATTAACSMSSDRSGYITAPWGSSASTTVEAAAPISFDCVDQGGNPIYAIYNARGRLSGNQPMNARVYRPHIGDTLSKRQASVLVSPARYPGYPQYNVWNVTGGPATGTTNYFFLLFPKVLPGPGGIFPAELHVQFNKGQNGSNQSAELCTVQ